LTDLRIMVAKNFILTQRGVGMRHFFKYPVFFVGAAALLMFLISCGSTAGRVDYPGKKTELPSKLALVELRLGKETVPGKMRCEGVRLYKDQVRAVFANIGREELNVRLVLFAKVGKKRLICGAETVREVKLLPGESKQVIWRWPWQRPDEFLVRVEPIGMTGGR
jgi:hypothetical protein